MQLMYSLSRAISIPRSCRWQLAGMAAGTCYALRRARSSDAKGFFRLGTAYQFALASFAPLLILLMLALRHASEISAGDLCATLAFPVLAFACGVPGGVQISLLAEIYFSSSPTKANLGAPYALDLMGGCGGAILLGGLLIPVFGFWRVAWLAAVMDFRLQSRCFWLAPRRGLVQIQRATAEYLRCREKHV